MISIRNKYGLWFIFSIFVFQFTIILIQAGELMLLLFSIPDKNNLFGNAIGGFSLSNPSDKFIPFYNSATNGTTSDLLSLPKSYS